MTEVQSYPFDLIITSLFIDKFNLSFSKADFDGTNKFQLVISTVCPDNLEDCLNSSGVLDTNEVTIDGTADIALDLYVQDEKNSFVRIKNNVTMTLANDVDVKGVFLRKKSNQFVIMGMVNQTPMRFCNQIVFEKDNVLLQLIK